MKKNVVTTIGMLIFWCASMVCAVQPNYVETTTYGVDGVGSNIVTTEYSDGLGRSLQSKLRLSATKDRVSCTFYDDAGRPSISTRPFADIQNPGQYLSGDLAAIGNQLAQSNKNDAHAYSQTEYWDNPTGGAKKTIPPGTANSDLYSRSWTFGVEVNATALPITVNSGTVIFSDGIVTELTFDEDSNLENLLDELNDHFLSVNPFEHPTHFLSISLDAEKHVGEQLSDAFGRVLLRYSGPKINSITGEAIQSNYHYDILGNVLKEIPPAVDGQTSIASSEYRYNTLGQMISKKTPDVDGEFVYDYNSDGSLFRQTHLINGGSVYNYLEYEYDALGRQTAIVQCIAPYSPRKVIEYFYDDAKNIPADLYNDRLSPSLKAKQSNLKGRLACSVAYNSAGNMLRVATIYSYDDDGRVNYKVTIIDGNPVVHEAWFEYDLHGKVTADYCFYGNVIVKKKYRYDNLGRLLNIIHAKVEPDGTIIEEKTLVEYAYNDLGEKTEKHFSAIAPVGYSVAYEQDLLGRVTSITTPPSKKGFSEIIDNFDKNGNIKNAQYLYEFNPANSAPEFRKQFAMNYTYDGLSRLKTVTSSLSPEKFSTHYDYDKIGRFLVKTEGANAISNYQYYQTNSRLKSTSRTHNPTHQYVYDLNGNVLVDFSKNMVIAYDWRNLPREFRFYSDLLQAKIEKNEFGTLSQWQLESMLVNNKIRLVSKVMMLYDADGNRVCKMDIKE